MTINHANREGTGSRLVVEIAEPVNDGEREMTFSVYGQSPLDGDFESVPKVSISLTAVKVAHVLSVLRGRSREILNGKGVCESSRNSSARKVLHLDAVRTPFDGFALHIAETDGRGKRDGRIVLNETEGVALEAALSVAVGVMAFDF